ncbi:MAG TPA: substrate-binding domain-containing protein [Stellaceae bacterium]|nr:substrate-binding domain-containing protein [Stellaceae bacterium]
MKRHSPRPAARLLCCIAFATTGLGFGTDPAQADELKVMSAGIMHFALKDVGDNFTHATGTTLAITFSGAGAVKTKIEKGEPVDVVILPKPDIADLAKAGLIAPDSVHDIARTALSIAVLKGQPKPDISSLAGVKEALLATKTIGYYDAAAGGADGVLADHDFARLGVVKEVAAKAKLWESVQEVIDEKSADLLVGWQPPLLSKAADYEFVGPLPPELQDPEHSLWTAGAATKAADLEKAKAFTAMLASPESLAIFKSKGYTPP